MYYIFQPKIDLKKETKVTGVFEVSMLMNNVFIETDKKLTDKKIEEVRDKTEKMLQQKFNIGDLTLTLINIIN